MSLHVPVAIISKDSTLINSIKETFAQQAIIVDIKVISPENLERREQRASLSQASAIFLDQRCAGKKEVCEITNSQAPTHIVSQEHKDDNIAVLTPPGKEQIKKVLIEATQQTGKKQVPKSKFSGQPEVVKVLTSNEHRGLTGFNELQLNVIDTWNWLKEKEINVPNSEALLEDLAASVIQFESISDKLSRVGTRTVRILYKNRPTGMCAKIDYGTSTGRLTELAIQNTISESSSKNSPFLPCFGVGTPTDTNAIYFVMEDLRHQEKHRTLDEILRESKERKTKIIRKKEEENKELTLAIEQLEQIEGEINITDSPETKAEKTHAKIKEAPLKYKELADRLYEDAVSDAVVEKLRGYFTSKASTPQKRVLLNDKSNSWKKEEEDADKNEMSLLTKVVKNIAEYAAILTPQIEEINNKIQVLNEIYGEEASLERRYTPQRAKEDIAETLSSIAMEESIVEYMKEKTKLSQFALENIRKAKEEIRKKILNEENNPLIKFFEKSVFAAEDFDLCYSTHDARPNHFTLDQYGNIQVFDFNKSALVPRGFDITTVLSTHLSGLNEEQRIKLYHIGLKQYYTRMYTALQHDEEARAKFNIPKLQSPALKHGKKGQKRTRNKTNIHPQKIAQQIKYNHEKEETRARKLFLFAQLRNLKGAMNYKLVKEGEERKEEERLCDHLRNAIANGFEKLANKDPLAKEALEYLISFPYSSTGEGNILKQYSK